MQESIITFNLRGKPTEFKVYNNLDEHGLDILAAFENWSVRTRNYGIKSFCNYVKSKDPCNLYCFTESEYQSLNQ